MERAPGHPADVRWTANRNDSDLAALRAEFPQFRIWGETARGRVRYVARRLDLGTGAHTIVTPDLAELRAELSSGRATPNASTPDHEQ